MKQRNLAFRVLCIIVITIISIDTKAQYVQQERDDTVRLFAKTPFDTLMA